MQDDKQTLQDNITSLKEWQAEAYLFVILYCCLKFDNTKYDLSKVCALYEKIGDIFNWHITINAINKVHTNCFFYGNTEFTTRLRQLPKESWQEVKDICYPLLAMGKTEFDTNIRDIIERELQ